MIHSTYLTWHGMGFANLVSPIAPSHWYNRQFGKDDGTPNGCGHLFGALHTQTYMAIVVANCNKGLETCTLTGTGLLLHRHDLQYFVLECSANEEINNLKLLQRNQIWFSFLVLALKDNCFHITMERLRLDNQIWGFMSIIEFSPTTSGWMIRCVVHLS